VSQFETEILPEAGFGFTDGLQSAIFERRAADGEMERSSDVVVIGAGHNGLICGAYLARAGLRVQVLERRAIVGGCTATEEVAPGVKISRCFCDHLFLYTTPIPEELALAQHGLDNLELDPCHYAPSLEGEALLVWKDVERTVDGIGRRSAKDARAYRRFVRQWSELFQWLQPILLGSPKPGAIARRMLGRPWETLGGLRNLPLLQRAQSASIRDVLDATFEDAQLKGLLAFVTAGLAGLAPSAPGSATLAIAAVVPHLVGARRPRGGSGGLVRSLIAALEACSARVRPAAAAAQILVEAGRVRGVRLIDGEEVEARTVVAACDPQTTFLRLLAPSVVPAAIRTAIERLQIANGFALKVDYLIDRIPGWKPHALARPEELARTTGYVCPSIDYLETAYRDYQSKRNPRWPALMMTTPTIADPGLAPEGAHLLTVETRYTPYALDGGVSWQAIREDEARRLFELLLPYAPDLAGAERSRFVQTPEDLERDLGLPRGHISHVDLVASQSLHRRPIPQLADYRTPIRGLYLTGVGTHPGGGVWGAPGRNAAHEILADLA
jgi:phytoene dehydrogenase-like protein